MDKTGWAVAQINEATHELVCSAHGAMPISLPVQRRITRAEVWPCYQPLSCPSQERRSSQTLKPCSRAWSVVNNNAHQHKDHMLTWRDESGNASETLVRKPTSIQ